MNVNKNARLGIFIFILNNCIFMLLLSRYVRIVWGVAYEKNICFIIVVVAVYGDCV